MKNSLSLRTLLLAGVALVAGASVASAEGITVSINGGTSMTQMTAKEGYNESVSNGIVTGLTGAYALSDMFSVELTAGYRFGYKYKGSNKEASTNTPAVGVETKGDVSSLSFIPAVRASYPVSMVKVYGLVGAGISMNSISGAKVTDFSGDIDLHKINSAVPAGTKMAGTITKGSFADATKNEFAYTLGAGVSYDVGSNFVVDLGYRFTDLGSFQPGAGKVTLNVPRANIKDKEVDAPAPDARHPLAHEIALTIGYRF
ncbi:MAG: outer membrane beta-barrel protein [Candidatus Pacebacteria bacterium]|nr:outer membrane beta-barrel protein [Candidatus Paceibacterota bacterium]